ncbi:MAG: WecB/TagA/CpsF family glycosyltransferase [Ruminococcaceae bacterium]|nr:WecB/TagA/CpsF family glycosyltransferase [Oscillospiraceae bacterium]
METKKIININVSNVDIEQATEEIFSLCDAPEASYVVTPNAEIAQRAYEDKEFEEIINNASVVIPDGIGVIIASKIVKNKLKGKLAGVELAAELLRKAGSRKFVFFGAGEGVAELAAQKVREKYPDIQIIKTINGYFENDEEKIKELAQLDADIIFVCLGAPKQEYFMAKAVSSLKRGVMIGLGGTLDVLAGTVKRSPKIFVKLNIEWLYRITMQPKRLIRAGKLPKYILTALKYRFLKK